MHDFTFSEDRNLEVAELPDTDSESSTEFQSRCRLGLQLSQGLRLTDVPLQHGLPQSR